MKSEKKSEPDGIGPSGFFALRTPLLPFDEFVAWSEGLKAEATLGESARLGEALAADRARLRKRLRALLERPVIRDALFIASPDLDESLDVWKRDPDSERGERIERAIVRYFGRMAGRPTPFGLFAGGSVGEIGDRTRLLIEGQEKYERHSRFDMDYLFALANALGRDPALRPALVFRPNSSLYRAAGRLHYVEARLDGKNRTHHLVAVEDSDGLQATLACAREGSGAGSLSAALIGEEVSATEADEYVAELIDSQILLPDLDLFVTGRGPAEALADQLRARPETVEIGDRLEKAVRDLSTIDAAGPGADPASYRAIARQLEGLPAPVELSRLFQVDMVKQSPEAVLGGAVLDEIIRGVEILRRLTPVPKAGDLSRFREAFLARYEAREVPLVEVLDEEVGIGFPIAGGTDDEGGPLLKGIELSAAAEPTVPWGARETFLLRQLTDAAAAGASEIVLDPDKLGELEHKDPLTLPGAFAVVVEVAAASEEALSAGNFRLLWKGSDGPSGARLLGRFCHADSKLLQFVERHLRAEEALDSEAVFAEIVHLPEGRLGNILFRPVLRGYEIPYLGRSGAPIERQIPITDLFVSVSGGRILLRSARLDRRVIPRLTTAHNYGRGLPLYRFLCALREEDAAVSLGWDWGALGSASFLPRVVCGRLVLAPASWNVGKDELKRFGASRGAERFRTIQSWRAERRLPRLIVLADGDNQLPIDLANTLSVESFVSLVKDRDGARLIEMFPGADELCARGPEGRFLHELIVPFVRTQAAAVDAPSVSSVGEKRQRPATPAVRSFLPGSEWLYAKLYTGVATADRLLLEIVAPLVKEALDSGAADRWFFIRYGDPDRHIRVRFHGVPERLWKEVLPALRAATAPLETDGRLRKLQLDTYEREIERYGGPEGIELAERVFQADSESVLEILEMLEEGDAGAGERWRLAFRGIDALVDDFGFAPPERLALVGAARREYGKEFRVDENVKRGLGDRFRKESKSLELLLDPAREEESPLAPGLAVLRRRSERLAPLIRDLEASAKDGRLTQPLASIARSYVHMHVNRMLRSAQRAQEFVLYDFLARVYESRAARARRGP